MPLTGRYKLELSLLHSYHLDEDSGWTVHTESYAYPVQDGRRRELMAYHWHPERGVSYPHAHFKGLTSPIDLSRHHIATGRVSLEAVVRFLISELAVTPLRNDWNDVLAMNERGFVQKRRWA